MNIHVLLDQKSVARRLTTHCCLLTDSRSHTCPPPLRTRRDSRSSERTRSNTSPTPECTLNPVSRHRPCSRANQIIVHISHLLAWVRAYLPFFRCPSPSPSSHHLQAIFATRTTPFLFYSPTTPSTDRVFVRPEAGIRFCCSTSRQNI